MQVVILGAGGYHPNDQRQTACVMIPERGVVLDAGTGFYRVRDYLQTSQLDIFLSHAHLDHVVGLTYLFNVLDGAADTHVTVRAEPKKLEAVRNHLLAEQLFPVALPCEFMELGRETNLPSEGNLTTFPLQHPGGTVGFRLDWPDRSLAYVTDTTAAPNADYVKHIRDVDLLIHECHFDDGHDEHAKLTGHSCLSDVAQAASDAEVGLLVLVHINPLVDEVEKSWLPVAKRIHANTIIGRDRMVLEL